MRPVAAVLLTILFLVSALPASSQPAAAPKSPAGALRGSPPVSAPAARPVFTPPPDPPPLVVLRPLGRAPDPALMSPSLALPVAPRLDGRLGTVDGGGSACRTQCAQTRYQCEGGEAGGDCGPQWSKCVLACPTYSGDTL